MSTERTYVNFLLYKEYFKWNILYEHIIFQFNKLFKFIEKEWEQLKLDNELHVLEEVVIEGNKMGQLYRSEINIQ